MSIKCLWMIIAQYSPKLRKKRFKCSSVNELKMYAIREKVYQSTIKNEFVINATIWINLANVMVKKKHRDNVE